MQFPQCDLNRVLSVFTGGASAAGEAPEVRLHGDEQLVERAGVTLKGSFHQLSIESSHDQSERFSLRPNMAHIGQKPMKPVQANTTPAATATHLMVGSIGTTKEAAITITKPMHKRSARSHFGRFF